MKKIQRFRCAVSMILAASMLSACGNSQNAQNDYPTPDDFEPEYYLSEEEIPEDTYCIVHEEGENVYFYPLLKADHTFDDTYKEAKGEDPSRVYWVNYNMDEGLIPTMYPGDRLIYKSATTIPTTYSLEKFYDNGYTFGVCGLKADLSGNYRFDVEDGGYTLMTSDAAGFESLEADVIYFVSADDIFLKNGNVSSSGTVTGLELMKTYACDIRTGTEKIAADLTANVHYFSSAETYIFGDFTFITEHIAEINLPDYASTGYYDINGAGFFRYLKSETSYKGLSAQDYNETLYAYDEYGKLDGTKDGRVFDENYFIVEDTEEDMKGEDETYDYTPEYMDLNSAGDVQDDVSAQETESMEEVDETDETESTEETEETEQEE